MRGWRGFARLALFGFVTLGAAAPARAQLLVAATPGEPPAIEHAELAYALGDAQSLTWLSLRVERGPVAVVAALPDAATIGQAVDGWLTALETTASPSVLVPPGSEPCGRTNLIRAEWPRAKGTPAVELRLDSADDVVALLEAAGLTLESELPEASSYAVWSWPALDRGQTTRTLRVAGAPPLSLLPGFDFPVALSLITTGPVRYENEVDKRELQVTFRGGNAPSSDYLERLVEFVSAGPTGLLETRSRGLLFDWSIYGDALSVAPLARTYPHEASSELADLDVDACSQQLRELGSAGAAPATDCGDAVDLGLALTAVDPQLATLQRLAVSSREGVSPAKLEGGGEPVSPLLTARHLDASGCETVTQPPLVRDPPPTTGGGSPPPTGAGQEVVHETVVVEREPVEVSCGGSPEPEPVGDYDYYGNDDSDESCTGDTSSDYDSTDDPDCSSDTSSSSDSSAEADCSSDSSGSSSSSSDDGCSGDSSTSSDSISSDSGCSGDCSSSETNGYDGDTCTGQAAPREGRPAQRSAGQARPQRSGAGAPRPTRLKTSLWSVAFAALVLPIRRRKRRASASG
ncbi:MAG TPA: hypothetical protein VJN18_13525 [Polyangiaceae bacterium]|nr:hypothetical protein [Polyangiaceae bacterium]